MDGQKLLKKLKRLSEVNDIRDVKTLTSTTYPGTHCPLFGAAIAMKGITDGVMLVIGTDECAYYTKNFTINDSNFGGLKGRCLSLVLDQHDITFGCREKLEKAIEEIIDEYETSTIFLVTTCVIEITGDDIDSLGVALSEKYNLPILTVHTEHFRCDSHMPGLENVLTECGKLMNEAEKDSSVNILGHRFGDIKKTEMYKLLEKEEVKVNLQLPSKCTVEEISRGGKAKVNIVCDAIALPLAEYMKEKFNTPYVLFEKFCSVDRIEKAYIELFTYLNLNIPMEIKTIKEETIKNIEESKKYFKDISYIYGNSLMIPFEVNEFLIGLGFKCDLIQTKEVTPRDREYMDGILEMKVEPYVCKSANIAPLQYVYDALKPNLYIGHESEVALRKKGIVLVRTGKEGDKLGFELPNYLVDILKGYCERALEIRNMEGGMKNVIM